MLPELTYLVNRYANNPGAMTTEEKITFAMSVLANDPPRAAYLMYDLGYTRLALNWFLSLHFNRDDSDALQGWYGVVRNDIVDHINRIPAMERAVLLDEIGRGNINSPVVQAFISGLEGRNIRNGY